MSTTPDASSLSTHRQVMATVEAVPVEQVDTPEQVPEPPINTQVTAMTASGRHLMVPMLEATAEPIADVEAGVVPSRARAEFLSASFLKASEDVKLGISVRTDETNGCIRVGRLTQDSVLRNSPLREGDKIVSINGKCCYGMDSRTVAGFLRQAVGYITIVVHNSSGASNLLETMIEKPTPQAAVGLGIRRSYQGVPEISKISTDGLFSHSLLNLGDRVLSINNVNCVRLEPQAVVDILRGAEKYVTIVTEHSTAVVMAAGSQRDDLEIAMATADHNSSRLTDDDFRQYQQHFCICSWMIIVSLLVVGAVVFATLKKAP